MDVDLTRHETDAAGIVMPKRKESAMSSPRGPTTRGRGRRDNGEGSITRRSRRLPNGEAVETGWQAAITLPLGKRKYLYGKTRKEVAIKLKEALAAAEAGLPVITRKHTVAELLITWLEESVKPNRAYGTYRSYRSHVREHLIPVFGPVECRELTVRQVEAYLYGGERSTRTGKPLSPRTRQYHRAILQKVLKVGQKWGWVAQNIVSLSDPVSVPEPERPVATFEEGRALLRALRTDPLYPIYLFCLLTGCRVGETAGLRYEDLDLDVATVAIRQQVQRVEGRLQEVPLKTRSSHGVLHLGPTLVAELRNHRVQTGRIGGLVFVTKTGRPYDPVYISHRFQDALARAGMRSMPIHTLRHWFASFLPTIGVHPSVAQSLLRHANVSTTLERYTGVTVELERQAVAAVDDALFAATDVQIDVRK
jgi:integrase